MNLLQIILKNIKNRPVRSVGLISLASMLSLAVLFGTIIVFALNRGFTSLESRLGADIMVVPYEAATKSSLENIVLQGNAGYFYMNGDVVDQIEALPGVGKITAQYYLASVSASCCSIPVQIIGYDPETDFVITPWITHSNGTAPGYMDVVVGNDLNAFVGDKMTFYGQEVRVAAKLDKTGTAYDTAVFTTHDTIKTLIEASLSKKLNEYSNINAGNEVSCVLIKTADGYNVDEVLHFVNKATKKTKAVRTREMISGIANSLSGISKITFILIILAWMITLLIMVAAFVVMTNERKKEFAIIRIAGASEKKLTRMILLEGLFMGLCGGIIGAAAGLIIVLPFNGFMAQILGLPFLLPNAARVLLVIAGAIILTAAAGAFASGFAAYRISKYDIGTIIRSEV